MIPSKASVQLQFYAYVRTDTIYLRNNLKFEHILNHQTSHHSKHLIHQIVLQVAPPDSDSTVHPIYSLFTSYASISPMLNRKNLLS